MKKITGIFLIFTLAASMCASYAASEKNVSSSMYEAMNKYRQKNYVGCVQDTKRMIDNGKPSDLAYYYQAISYARLGMANEAKEAYTKAAEVSKNKAIINYANQGLQCINNPSSCDDSGLDEKDISVFIKSGKFLHPEVEEALQKQASERVKAEINSGNKLDEQDLKYLNMNDLNQNPLQPTDKEIADAVRTFQKLGINPFSGGYSNLALSQNADSNLIQMNAFLNRNNNNDNNLMNLIPLLVSMQKQGQNSSGMGKEMVQAMLYNQMLPNLNFSSNDL